MVADLQVVDALADLHDGAGTFVAEHRGERQRQRAVRDREVGVADAGGAELDPHLTGLGIGEIEIHDLERLPDFGCDGGLRHSGSPSKDTVWFGRQSNP